MLKPKEKSSTFFPQELVKLGLSWDEARTYSLLVNRGALTALELAKGTEILPNAVYRLISNLERKGFVVVLNGRPKSFQAIPPSVAVETFAKEQTSEIERLKTVSIKGLAGKEEVSFQTRMEIFTGRNDMFLKYHQLARETKEEVLIISLGEEVSEEIKIVNRDLVAKGVTIKFLSLRFGQQNEQLLRNWVKMGLEVRHFPGEAYHLVVFDSQKSILAASNPKNGAERSTVCIYSPSLSRALRDYFYSLWEKATPIKKF